MTDNPNDLRSVNDIQLQFLYQAVIERDKSLVDLAALVFKQLSLLNGGAVVGILTFLGNNPEFSAAVTHVRMSLFCFVGGLASGLLAAAFAYFAQSSFSEEDLWKAKELFARISARDDRAVKRLAKQERALADLFRAIAVLFATTAFVAFCGGAWYAISGLAPLPSTTG